MTILLIPAIDIKGGRCVRLRQGDMSAETVYSDDPPAVARKWAAAGAARLHLIDLDGAAGGRPVNAAVIHDIVEACPQVAIQVGGGIRDEDTIQAYLDAGVNYVIIGTRAVTTPHFVGDACLEFPGRVIVALDAKEGKLATEGWSKLSHHDVIDIARRLEQDGASAIIFTDIGRDGMMERLNLDATRRLAQEVAVPVIASGGIRDLEDIRALCTVPEDNIIGAITGRAIYEGALDFKEALSLAARLGAD